MGVKGFTAIIQKLAPEAITEVQPSYYKNKVVAVDTMLLIYKFLISILSTGDQLRRSDGKVTTHLNSFLYFIKNMLANNMTPVFVIDGKAPDIKKETITKRQEGKEKAVLKLYELDKLDKLDKLEKIKLEKRAFTPSREIIRDVKSIINLFGLSVIQAIGEADPQCASLNIVNKVDIVISDDIDTLLFGAHKLAKNFSFKKKSLVIDLKVLLKKLEFTQEQLIEFGILVGCDYCVSTINGLGGLTAFKKYKQYGGSMEKLIKGLEEENKKEGKVLYKISDTFKNTWKDAKEYYMTANIYDPNQYSKIKWSTPDYLGLTNLLVIDNQFNKNKVDTILKEVEKMYNKR